MVARFYVSVCFEMRAPFSAYLETRIICSQFSLALIGLTLSKTFLRFEEWEQTGALNDYMEMHMDYESKRMCWDLGNSNGKNFVNNVFRLIAFSTAW